MAELYKSLSVNGVSFPLAVAQSGHGAPTEHTIGSVGLTYMDTDTGAMYKCTSASEGQYVWKSIVEGGQAPDSPTAVVVPDKSITPQKTTFFEGRAVSSEYPLVLGWPADNWTGIMPTPETPKEEIENKWVDVNFNSLGSALGANGKLLLTPFTGHLYLRVISDTYNAQAGLPFFAFTNKDIIANPTKTLGQVGTKYTEATISVRQTFDWTDHTGVLHKASFTRLDEDTSSVTSSPEVHLFEITTPPGVYLYIISRANLDNYASHGCPKYPLASMWCVFDQDPTNDILQDANNYSGSGGLALTKQYERSFMEYLVQNKEFVTAFQRYCAGLIPYTCQRHTAGKTLYLTGDSLAQYAGGDGVVGTGFLTQVNKYLGMKMKNTAVAGTHWTGEGTDNGPAKVQKLLDDNVVYDVIILAWGTNGDTIPSEKGGERTSGNGSIGDPADKNGSMVAVMKWAVEAIRDKYPTSGLGIIIPPDGAGMSQEKADLMIQVCESKRLRVPYLNLYYHSGIANNNKSSGGLGSDQVHIHKFGTLRYASALGEFIERICPYVDIEGY